MSFRGNGKGMGGGGEVNRHMWGKKGGWEGVGGQGGGGGGHQNLTKPDILVFDPNV